MSKTLHFTFSAALSLAFSVLISQPATAQLAISLPACAPARPQPQEHNAAEDTEKIRFHHMQQLDAKLALKEDTVGTLKEGCRYKSAIAVSPPHKRVALTFDDGPEPGQTEHILAVLHKHQISAAFFMVGEKALLHPELVAAVQAEGTHRIGNHSWSHPNFHAISVEQQRQEVLEAEHVLSHVLTKKLFRYPYGNSTCETNALLMTEGYATVGWHVDSCDWAFDRTGKVNVREALECGVLPQYTNHYVEHVVSAVRAHNGGIVLMHEIHANTVRQLEEVIERLKAEGFEFGALDEGDFSSSLLQQ